MLSTIKRIFRRRHQEETPQRIPAPGETWDFISGPWPPTHRARVLDVRDGWVRYRIVGVWRDYRMSLDSFTKIYLPPRDVQ